ncbi:MAG: hypothetical protein OEQ53_11650, partial [Saprospiraceae bacterium]|nr:hypothetical protein [Saprospiraceae bacterium]
VITLGLRGIDRWNPTALIVEVTLLLELFETQKNIVTIKCNGQNDFFYLKKGVTQQSISLLE